MGKIVKNIRERTYGKFLKSESIKFDKEFKLAFKNVSCKLVFNLRFSLLNRPNSVNIGPI